jgi:hypothetical protein
VSCRTSGGRHAPVDVRQPISCIDEVATVGSNSLVEAPPHFFGTLLEWDFGKPGTWNFTNLRGGPLALAEVLQ